MKRPLERLRRRYEDNIKIDLKKRGCKDVDFSNVAQGVFYWWHLVNTATGL
jgi:hypothetical protein